MRLFVVVRGVNVLEGRLRPFPAKPVVGPAFTPGSEESQSCFLSCRFCNVSRVYAAPPASSGRSPVNRADTMRKTPLVPPGVNAGPNTAFGGKPDKSGSALQRLNAKPTHFHESLDTNTLRLIQRYCGLACRLFRLFVQASPFHVGLDCAGGGVNRRANRMPPPSPGCSFRPTSVATG